MDNQAILTRVERDGVVWLVKNDPERSNAMSLAMAEALAAELDDMADARALVIDASGQGFHSSAVLVSELCPDPSRLTEQDFARISAIGRNLGDKLASLPIPVIGIARAGALGGGLELLMRCDLLFCHDKARFKLPEAAFGFVAAWGGTQYGARQMPFRQAQEFLLLGEAIDGCRAAEIGLVTRSFANDGEIDRHVEATLRRLRRISATAFRCTKNALWAGWHKTLSEGLDFEAVCQAEALRCGDYVAGMAAAAAHREFDYVAGCQVDKPQ
tara:strand:+ start:2352 stop:3164 length:813 start_codon:yes stop_codon:yes gene_type:complete